MSDHSFSLVPGLSDNFISDRFKQIDNMFSRLTGEKNITDMPRYDLIQDDNQNYRLIVNVAGYTIDNLDVKLHNDKLTITGQKNSSVNKTKKIKWLHQGIQKNNFSLSFNLEHTIKIKTAEIDLGLLTIQFTCEIPDEVKPKTIDIISKDQRSHAL